MKKVFFLVVFVLFLVVGCRETIFDSSVSSLNTYGTPGFELLDSKDPIVIRVWTYYNSRQKEVLDRYIERFNNGRGARLGILVEQVTYGVDADLRDALLCGSKAKGGKELLPDLFISYKGMASEIEKEVILVDLNRYFSKDELDMYVDEFLEKSSLPSNPNALTMFPIGKSSDILLINKTAYDKYVDLGVLSYADLGSYESLVKAAERYYEYTDSLTEEVGDGKALFGFDTIRNLVFKYYAENGKEFLDIEDGVEVLNMDPEFFRRFYYGLYVPYLKGYYAKENLYVTDDIRMGTVIVGLCSSERAPYFPDTVLNEDETMSDITVIISDVPVFNNRKHMLLLRDAGAFLIYNNEKSVVASVEFLKWLVDKENNLDYSIQTSYLPVRKDAFNIQSIENALEENLADDTTAKIFISLVDKFQNSILYDPVPTAHYESVRNVLHENVMTNLEKNRQAFVEMLECGVPYEEALEMFVNEKHFEAWYRSLKKELEHTLHE